MEDYDSGNDEIVWDELCIWLRHRGINPDQTIKTDRGTHLHLSTSDLLDAALEAALATAREAVLNAAILEVQGCIEPYSELDGTDEEKVAISNASLRYAITRIESLRAAQPEPEAGALPETRSKS